MPTTDRSAEYAAGAQILTTGINVAVAGAENKKARKYGREMAQWQWDKNIEAWNMQNAYNTPAMQMQRFEDAGLNPNLIYGQGESGNAGGIPAFQKPEAAFGLPEINLVDAISIYQDLKQKQAQTDNIRKQNLLIDEQISSQLIDNLTKAFDLAYNSGQDTPEVIPEKYSWKFDADGEGQRYYQFEALKEDVEGKKRANRLGREYDTRLKVAEVLIKELEHRWLNEREDRYNYTNGKEVLGQDNYTDRLMQDMMRDKPNAQKTILFLNMLKNLGK